MEKYTDMFNPSFLKSEKRPQFPKEYSLAMAYIPLQECLETYDGEEALKNGTLFPELNKVFKGRTVAR